MKSKNRFIRFFSSMICIVLLLFIFGLAIPDAMAGGKSGVWPVELRAGSVELSGTSAYVIDLTAKSRYTGNIVGQLSGVTTVDGLSPPADSGVTVYWSENTFSSSSDHESWSSVTWTAISGTGSGTFSALPYLLFDIPANSASPYVGIKFELSGVSNLEFGFKYSTSGNP